MVNNEHVNIRNKWKNNNRKAGGQWTVVDGKEYVALFSRPFKIRAIAESMRQDDGEGQKMWHESAYSAFESIVIQLIDRDGLMFHFSHMESRPGKE